MPRAHHHHSDDDGTLDLMPSQNNHRGRVWTIAGLMVLSGIILSTIIVTLSSYRQPSTAAVVTAASPHSGAVPKRKRITKKHDDDDDDDDDVPWNLDRDCEDDDYAKRTMKLAYERSMAALFPDYEKKYETSSVIVVDDAAYAICDSSWSIYKFGLDLQPLGNANIRLGDPDREESEDSDYEALSYFEGTFYVVRESVKHDDKTYHAIIEEIQLDPNAQKDGDKYSVGRQCSTEFEFEGDSKGFEGVWAVRNSEEELVLVGLCEGNHCSEKHKRDRGNGRLVVMKQSIGADHVDGSGDCTWETVRTIHIPPSANFADYSAMTVNKDGYIAITSQEDSQLWVGRLLGKEAGTEMWDVDNMSFDQVGEVFDFPKDNDCATIYCNIEGIHWIDDGTLLAASDQMKKKGKQDFRCREKDQSVHVFVLP